MASVRKLRDGKFRVTYKLPDGTNVAETVATKEEADWIVRWDEEDDEGES
jgi:mRNA-degrading endonuclease RelE of RelBE toxin-antitoxin system